jgi:hypothetical protein
MMAQVPLEAADQEEIPREDLAPVIMRGHWRLDPRQRSLFARLRWPRRACMPEFLLEQATCWYSSTAVAVHRRDSIQKHLMSI